MNADDPLVHHELDDQYQARARRLALFHTTLRGGGVSRWLAATLTLVEAIGYHVPWPPSSD